LNFGIKKPVITLKGNDREAGILLPPKENRCNDYISIFMSSKEANIPTDTMRLTKSEEISAAYYVEHKSRCMALPGVLNCSLSAYFLETSSGSLFRTTSKFFFLLLIEPD
jgi:hypothetical protein